MRFAYVRVFVFVWHCVRSGCVCACVVLNRVCVAITSTITISLHPI
jgi:hypothetical protein